MTQQEFDKWLAQYKRAYAFMAGFLFYAAIAIVHVAPAARGAHDIWIIYRAMFPSMAMIFIAVLDLTWVDRMRERRRNGAQ